MSEKTEHDSDHLRDASAQPEATAEPVELPFATAPEIGVEDHEVPSTVEGMLKFSFDPVVPTRKADQVVGRCTYYMAKDQRPINNHEKQIIFDVLKSINSLGTFTQQNTEGLRLRDMLSSVLGETSRPTKPFEYPEPLQRNAAIIRDRLDNELAAEEAIDASTQSDSEPSSANPENKRKRGRPRKSASPTATAPTSTRTDVRSLRQILPGIIISKGKRRTYSLDPNYRPPPRNCSVVGHNGLEVGQWWPLRVCAIRDGAHGAMQAGIAGGATTGAYSIVTATQYEALDKDLGNVIYYSGSNSHSNMDPEKAIYTYSTKALLLSMQQSRPVRVIRSASQHNRHAPSMGLRYDGLYNIAEEKIEKNPRGGAYLRFKMVRRSDQPAVDHDRPNEQERRIWERVREKSSDS